MSAPTLGDVFSATQQPNASTAMEIDAARMGGNDYTTDDDHPEYVIIWAFVALSGWAAAALVYYFWAGFNIVMWLLS